jgi:hypothetical protein
LADIYTTPVRMLVFMLVRFTMHNKVPDASTTEYSYVSPVLLYNPTGSSRIIRRTGVF